MIQKIKTAANIWFVMALERYLFRPLAMGEDEPEKGLVWSTVSAMVWLIVLVPPLLVGLSWLATKALLGADLTNREEA